MGARGLVATGVPPAQPVWLLYLKGGILFLSLLLLAFGAWNTATPFWGGGAGGMAIFCAIWNFLFYGSAVALEFYAPQYYWRIMYLITHILAIIFLLATWAWAASLASFTSVRVSSNVLTASIATSSSDGNQLHTSLSLVAAFGAFCWIATIVHLVFFIRASIADDNGISGTSQAELGQVKHAEVPQAAPQYPQQYPAQQQQQQAFVQQQPYATQ